MYINIIFALYIIAMLISLVCLVFIGLILVRKNDRENKIYISVRRFASVVLLTILYFITVKLFLGIMNLRLHFV